MAAPLGHVDKIVVIDQNNGNGNGGSGLSRLTSNGPATVFGLLQQMEALGLNQPALLSQLGIHPPAPKPDAPAPGPGKE